LSCIEVEVNNIPAVYLLAAGVGASPSGTLGFTIEILIRPFARNPFGTATPATVRPDFIPRWPVSTLPKHDAHFIVDESTVDSDDSGQSSSGSSLMVSHNDLRILMEALSKIVLMHDIELNPGPELALLGVFLR
jgi:hypothetical protein